MERYPVIFDFAVPKVRSISSLVFDIIPITTAPSPPEGLVEFCKFSTSLSFTLLLKLLPVTSFEFAATDIVPMEVHAVEIAELPVPTSL